MVKPGSRNLGDGTIQKLQELPKIDLDKIRKYLVQSNIRKSLQNKAMDQKKMETDYAMQAKSVYG